MRPFFALISVALLAGCTTAADVELAEQYKLELQYTQYAHSFAQKGMRAEALERCQLTSLLASECALTITQAFLQQGIIPPPELCEAIRPGEGIAMSNRAFAIVYKELDADLAAELKAQMRPPQERVQRIGEIQEDCRKAVSAP